MANGDFRTYQVTASGPDVHHDALLSTIAVAAFDMGEDTFIADKVFPSVPVAKQSDRFAIIDKGNFLRIEDALRAPKTAARKVEFQVSSAPYFCDNYALAAELSLEDLANADQAFSLRDNSVKLVVSDLRRAQEQRVSNIVTSASNLGSGTTLSGGSQWQDFVNSDPLGDVNTAHAFIQQQSGLIANTCVLDFDTFKIVRRHPDLLDMYKFVSGGQLSRQQIADAFDVENLWIGQGVIENALEGGTSSMTNLWGKNALFAHIAPPTGLSTRTLGLRFVWQPGGFPAPLAVTTNREAGAGKRNVEIIEAQHFQDEVIVATDLGYLIGSTVA